MKKHLIDIIGYLLFILSSWFLAHLFIRLNIEGGESIIREPSVMVRSFEVAVTILIAFFAVFLAVRYIKKIGD